MRTPRLRLAAGDLALPAVAAAATILAAYMTVRLGAQVGAGVVLVIALYVATVIGFLYAPQYAVAVTIVLFPLIPALKVFVRPEIGAAKDLVVLAALTAGVVLAVFERRRPDRWTFRLVLLLLGLYVVNPGHGHDVAWAQGVRLQAEPLVLLLVGMLLPNPARNLRYGLAALVGVAAFVALYGLFQQVVGQFTLVSWGYSFDAQVRTIGGLLRSFGTLDDPFAYAMVLLLAIGALWFWARKGLFNSVATGLLLLGLASSFVRTGVLVLAAFAGLVMVRWRYTTAAVFFVIAILVVSIVSLVGAGGSRTRTLNVLSSRGPEQVTTSSGSSSSINVILNGRISAWTAAIGNNPFQWVIGRGVGTVGTAAQRASSGFAPSTGGSQNSSPTTSQSEAVDSGYLATIADVGILGLGVLVALLARLWRLGAAAARRGISDGWVALALLVTIMLDALTRAAFTEFPTAFVGMLLIGIALTAAQDDRRKSGSLRRA